MTSHKKLRLSSSERAGRLRALFDALDTPVIAVDDGGIVTEVNNAGLALLGIDKERYAVGQHFVETYIVHDSHRQVAPQLCSALLGLHAQNVVDVGVSTRTGDVTKVTLKMACVRGKDGSSQGAIVQVKETMRVASPHDQAGTTPSESIPHVQPEALPYVLETLGTPSFALDRNCNVQKWNSMAADVTGLPLCEVQGKPFVTHLIHKSHRSRVQHAVQQACNGIRVPKLSPIRLCRKSGRPIEVILSLGPLSNKIDSKADVAVGVFEDITSFSMRCADASQEAESAHRLLQEANAPMFAIDLEGNVEEWNERMAAVTGLSKSSVMGEPVMGYIAECSVSTFRDALVLAGVGKLGEVFELAMRKTGDSSGTLTLIAGLSPRFGLDNNVVGAFCVTQVAPKTGQIFGAQSRRECQAEAKSVVMHELRSPLHGIIGLSSSLSMDHSPMQRHLKLIHKSAERVLEMVHNLMDYWSLSEGVADLSFEIIDMKAFVIDALARCEQARDKGGKPLKKESVKIISNVAEEIPKVEADPQYIAQLLFHLLSNALKFTKAGHVKVTVTATNGNGAVEVTVEDTGSGIAPDNTSRIFEAYQQEHSPESRVSEGIGLGLAICKEVVKKHGGSISVWSIQGCGSKFVVTLPCKQSITMESSTEEKTRTSKQQAGEKQWTPSFDMTAKPLIVHKNSQKGSQTTTFKSLSNRFGGKKALRKVDEASIAGFEGSATPLSLQSSCGSTTTSEVGVRPRVPVVMSVDDNPADQEIIRAALEPSGFKLIKCMSGSECFEHLDNGEEKPDMILLDLVMPGLSGLEVVEVYRKKYPMDCTPIIMVSAKQLASSVVQALELGCTDWINKPFIKNELLARIRAHLHTRTAITKSLACLPAPICDMPESESDGSHQDAACSDSGNQESDDDQTGQNTVSPQSASNSSVAGGPKGLLVALNASKTGTAVQTAVPSPQVAYRNTLTPPNEAGSNTSTASCSKCIGALFAVVTTLPDDGCMEFVAGLFSEFNCLSKSHGCVHTEMIGMCYVALTESSPGSSSHVDGLFKLAMEMEEAVRKNQNKLLPHAPVEFSAGIHAAAQSRLHSHCESTFTPRSSRLFGVVVHLAKVLAENARYGHIVLSRSVRSCLHGDVEAQARSRGFSLVEVHKLPSHQGWGDSDHFCLVSNKAPITKPAPFHCNASSAGVSLASWDVGGQEDVTTVWTDQLQELQGKLSDAQQKVALTTERLTATEQRVEAMEKSSARIASAHASDISKLRHALDAQANAEKLAKQMIPGAAPAPCATPCDMFRRRASEPPAPECIYPRFRITDCTAATAMHQHIPSGKTSPQLFFPDQGEPLKQDASPSSYWDTPLPRVSGYPVGMSSDLAAIGSWDLRSSPWMSTSTSLAPVSGLGVSFSTLSLR